MDWIFVRAYARHGLHLKMLFTSHNFFISTGNIFSEEIAARTELGLQANEKFVLMRFVSWEAAHDIGKKRMSLEFKKKLIDLCARYARVFIISESPLSGAFEAFRLSVSPEKILDVLNIRRCI